MNTADTVSTAATALGLPEIALAMEVFDNVKSFFAGTPTFGEKEVNEWVKPILIPLVTEWQKALGAKYETFVASFYFIMRERLALNWVTTNHFNGLPLLKKRFEGETIPTTVGTVAQGAERMYWILLYLYFAKLSGLKQDARSKAEIAFRMGNLNADWIKPVLEQALKAVGSGSVSITGGSGVATIQKAGLNISNPLLLVVGAGLLIGMALYFTKGKA